MLNYISLLLLLIIFLSVLGGWQRGFILGMLDLVRWVGSLVISLLLYVYVANGLSSWLSWPQTWILPTAFLITFFLANLLLHYLGSLLLNQLPIEVHRKRANRVLGILPGLVSGIITAAVTAILLLIVPLPTGVRDHVLESNLVNGLASKTERLEAALSPVFSEAIERTLTSLTVQPESKEVVKLPFTFTNAPPRPNLETQMLGLINVERVAAGLAPLKADPALTEVARQHSADMFARGYFSHITPDERSPADRIREAGVRFRVSGGNLALAPTLTVAHNGLMDSPGHRANILESRFGRVGIGILDGGIHGLMITQNFRN